MQRFLVHRILRGMEPVGELPTDKKVLFSVLNVAWPSIMESFLTSLVGIIDTMMVGVLGPSAIAAVGLTTQPKFIGLSVFISLNMAVSAIVARRKGENDRQSANKVLMQALVITVMLAVVVSAICVIFAEPIVAFAGAAEDTLADAAMYFKVIMGGMLFLVVSLVINAAQRGVGNTKIALLTNITSNLVNVVFNYLLIGGNFGFPRLGVLGAAVATVLGTVVACFMSIFSVLRRGRFLYIGHIRRISFDKKTLGTISSIGSSTFADQVFLRIGFFTYAIIVANLGTIPFAAHQIGANILSISFSLGNGLSVASIALVGQSLGAKRQDLAKIYGGFCQRIGAAFSLCLAILYLSAGKQIFMLFSDDIRVLDYSSMIMQILTVILFLQISQIIYSGCLRGAGDAKYTALVSLVSVAFIRPFFGWLFSYPLGLGLFGAWLGLAADQLVRYLMTWIRFRSGKWMYLRF